ncbi:LacI family DNA-binding transcriptional regulator [Aliagarivorans taiwanensis]|uniref:LacI family DNA-binding transcriptional regulator n=1 Tax=Aliagarivorans taiwanensis TaxID=561966 RepID=UPI0003FB7F6D|nr:LacI family DNA-binding transcriptional regulator [Aliagarivorans taiwanensis]
MAKATLKTIAEYTGLSVTTVSRALKDGDDVKAPTKEIVKAAAKKLGYRPNPSGVGLRTGINYNICAVLPVTKPGDIVGDIGTLALIEGLTAALEGTPYHLTVLPMEPDSDPLEPVKYAVENNLCGGMIFNLTKTQDERVAYLYDNEIPFVTFGQTEMSIDHAFVDIDNRDAAYRATHQLITQGRKNLRLLSSSQIYTYAWHKYYGARRAAMEFGIDFDIENNIIFDTDVNGGYRELGAQIMRSDNPPDGIVCGSEISACGILAGVQDAGAVIGKDIDVVVIETCDFPSFFMPPIPGYRQDFHQVGRQLIQHLLRLFNGEPIKNLQTLQKTVYFER